MSLSRIPTPQYGATQGALIISRAPVDAKAKEGLPLVSAGVLTVAGVYECEFATDAMNTIEVELMPKTVVGSFAPALHAMRASRESFRTADTDTGGNFANGVTEVLTLTNLLGKQVAKVIFTIPGAGSVTFDAGTDQASPTGIAEFNGL